MWGNYALNTLGPRQKGCHFADNIFICIFLNENVWISIKNSPKFVLKRPIYDIPALIQIIAWRRPDDRPLSQPMVVRLPTHVCVTRSQWVLFLWRILECIHNVQINLYERPISHYIQQFRFHYLKTNYNVQIHMYEIPWYIFVASQTHLTQFPFTRHSLNDGIRLWVL